MVLCLKNVLLPTLQLDVLCIGYLGQEGTSDEDLHQHGDDELDNEEDDGCGTLLSDATETITNGGLGLQGEEESPRQGLHLHHTGGVVRRGVELWRNTGEKKTKAHPSCSNVLLLKITTSVCVLFGFFYLLCW